MTIARSLDLCNQLVTLAGTVSGFPSGDGSAIQRAYALSFNVDLNDPTTFIWGRQVWIFPATQSTDQESRQDLLNGHEIGIVIAELYLSTPAVFSGGNLVTAGAIGQGQPPNSWIDARVTWTESLYDALKAEQQIAGTVGQGFFRLPKIHRADLMIYDTAEILERKLFFSEIQLTFAGWTNLQGG